MGKLIDQIETYEKVEALGAEERLKEYVLCTNY
jgi:hypothetical protein